METKKCRICGEEKDLETGFNLHHLKGQYRYISDKYRTECKVCQYKKCKKYRDVNKEKIRAYQKKYKPRAKAWREKHFSNPENREKARQYARDHYDDHREYENFRCKIKRQFDLTIDDYNDLLISQNNGCAICGSKKANKKAKRLAVDHDHKTGKVRGLLCTRCNRILGSFQDNPSLLRKAAQYLEQ